MTSTLATIPVHQRTRATMEQAIEATASSPNNSDNGSAPEEVPVPTDQDGIDELRIEIDAVDAELVRLILHRTAVSHAIGTARRPSAGRRSSTAGRWRSWNASAHSVPPAPISGMLLLAMVRGKLGRK